MADLQLNTTATQNDDAPSSRLNIFTGFISGLKDNAAKNFSEVSRVNYAFLHIWTILSIHSIHPNIAG